MGAHTADSVRWFAAGLIARLHWLQHPKPFATQPENNVWEVCEHYLCREAQRLLSDGNNDE